VFIISLVVIAKPHSICSLADNREDKMGVLVFVCPTSSNEVVTGLEIDPELPRPEERNCGDKVFGLRSQSQLFPDRNKISRR